MSQPIRLSPEMLSQLRCPACGAELALRGDVFQCRGASCNSSFPVIRGVPVLFDEQASIFSAPANSDQWARPPSLIVRVKDFVDRLLPDVTGNLRAAGNYRKLAGLLHDKASGGRAKVLVVGGRVQGEGMDCLLGTLPDIELVQTDVVLGPASELLCDAHSLPFANNSFDCVIIQAVLEHVLDPYRCAAELYRVLKDGGLVYAETPFMQQVHLGRYDFTRFTHLGHRRLFRRFEEVESGATCGPGTALAWSYRYFLSCFSENKWLNWSLVAFARLTSFHLKYFDRLLIAKRGAYDAASAYYFMGRKSPVTLSDRELVKQYKGAQ